MAEWSNATDLRSVLFGGAGSNPAGVIINDPYGKNKLYFDFHSKRRGSIPWVRNDCLVLDKLGSCIN